MLWTMLNNPWWLRKKKIGINKEIPSGFLNMFLISLVLCLLTTANVWAFTQPSDSVGVERRKGQLYILHKVAGGETLYSISRKYGAPMRDLINANENTPINDLAIGDTLRVPYINKAVQTNNQKILAVHEVQSTETLYSISRKYEVDVQEIRTWNQLGNQPLAIGQRLIIYDKARSEPEQITTPGDIVHIVKQGETLYSLSKTYQVSVDQLIAWNSLTDASIDLGDALIIGKKQTQTVQQPSENPSNVQLIAQTEETVSLTPEVQEPPKEEKKEVKAQRAEEKKEVKGYEKISEMGFASPIEGKTDTKKYLALHRTAPVGTIMQVRNEMNNLNVFVRVVGKLPNTGINEKISIRITQAAYESLGGINDRIPVEISYIP